MTTVESIELTGLAAPAMTELQTIAHDGKVVVIGTAADALYYTVRQSGFEDGALRDSSSGAIAGFEDWKPLPLDTSIADESVRKYEAEALIESGGRPLIRSLYGADAARPTLGGVKLVSGLGHLYLFRVSSAGRLEMSRFVLDGMANLLVPKLEVRYRRSRQKLVPDGDKAGRPDRPPTDTLGARDLDQQPFSEPATELTFVGDFEPDQPWFSVELMNTAEHDRHRWNLFVHTDGELRLFSVSTSADGLFDLSDQIKTQKDPDKADKTLIRTVPGLIHRRLSVPGEVCYAFDSTAYHNQVERMTKSGPQLLKENTRIMLAVPTRNSADQRVNVVALSFAVNNLGLPAQVDQVADRDELLVGTVKQVLLPLTDLEEIKLMADRTPPPQGVIAKLEESRNELLELTTDVPVQNKMKPGQQVKISGTRSYDGVHVATNVSAAGFDIDDPPGEGDPDGSWEAIDDGKGLVFENMIASYERTDSGALKITCLSHNIEEGDEIKITGSVAQDGVYPVTEVGADNSFELDRLWPAGEVINLSRRKRRGLSFDGHGDHLTVGPIEAESHSPSTRLERTVSGWVNLNEIKDAEQTIFAAESGLVRLYVDRQGRPALEVRFADGHRARVTDSEPLPIRSWVHLNAQVDYRGETTGETELTIHRNGRPAASHLVAARKPLHLPSRSLRLDRQSLAIETLNYDINLPESITVEAWVNTRQSETATIASWYQNRAFQLDLVVVRGKRIVRWSVDGNRLDGKIEIADNTWHHVAAVYNAKTGEQVVYIDGAEDIRLGSKNGGKSAGKTDRYHYSPAVAEAKGEPFRLGFMGSAGEDPVPDAATVHSVEHNGGSYWQTGADRWESYDRSTRPISSLTEEGRSKHVIRLRDDDGTSVHLDLAKNRVIRIVRNVPTDLGPFVREPVPHTGAIAGGSHITNAAAITSAALMGRGPFTSGGRSYRLSQGGRWQAYDKRGKPVDEPLRVIGVGPGGMTFRNDEDGYTLLLTETPGKLLRVDDKVETEIGVIRQKHTNAKVPTTAKRYRGYLADARIWGAARSARQVSANRTVDLSGTERSLIAHWKLAESTARQLSDATRNKAHLRVLGSDAGPAWFTESHRAPGHRDHYDPGGYRESLTIGARLEREDRHVMEFDGESGHLKLPSVSDRFTDGFTIQAWARWDSLDGGPLLDLADGKGDHRIVLSARTDQKGLTLEVDDASLDASAAPPLGEWIHVSATIAEDGSAALYLDGEPVARGAVALPAPVSRSSGYIGRSNDASEKRFKGAVRDLQLWDRALEVDEIRHFRANAAGGNERGLIHHWPMRTATIKGKKAVVDQGTATARHAQLRQGAEGRKTGDDIAQPRSELQGKLSDLQWWEINRPDETIRRTMYDQLTGNELGLLGYWRLGGIVEDRAADGSGRRVSPDFSSSTNDAVVMGDTYVSACDLARRGSAGRAVKYSNDDLIAVTQAARYRESFEFRAVGGDGRFLTLDELDDVDGKGNRIFEFGYWGTKARTSEERLAFRADESYDFIELGAGWFRARCDITVPEGINMIRCFELVDVRGRWADELEPPEGEWAELNVRRHRMELISDSISRRTYTDDLTVPTLLDDASKLERTIETIPARERTLARNRETLTEVLESLAAFENLAQFQAEQAALVESTTALAAKATNLDELIGAYADDPLNYRWMLKSKALGFPLGATTGWGGIGLGIDLGIRVQAWEFFEYTAGVFRIALLAGGAFLTSNEHGQLRVRSSTQDPSDQLWEVLETGAGYQIRHKRTGWMLDLEDESHWRSDAVIKPQNGKRSQTWDLVGWTTGSVALAATAIRLGRDSKGYRMAAEQYARAYPHRADKKTGYDSMLSAMQRSRDTYRDKLATEQTRLLRVEKFLGDVSEKRRQQLIEERDRLEGEIQLLELELNRLNTEYLETAASITADPQTMSLVAEDGQGLKTYGAVLGFAEPAGPVTARATAEGNVQLSYFDSWGRMRFTDYDATSDTANSAYEQWLPDTINVCPDMDQTASKVRLDVESPIRVPLSGYTAEAWIYLPLPFQSDGRPYPLSKLTSDANGREAVIAVAGNRRLGSVVDGYFHDAGIDLSTMVERGWHHLAAKGQADVTQFYIDGEPVGLTADEQRARPCHALELDPENAGRGYLKLGPMSGQTHDFRQGITVQGWIKRGAGRLVLAEFGNRGSHQIRLAVAGAGHLGFFIGRRWILAEGAVVDSRWVNVAATIDRQGVSALYVDGIEVAREELDVPPTVDRAQNCIGIADQVDRGERAGSGSISQLQVWNRARTLPELQDAMFEPPAGSERGLLHFWPMALETLDGNQRIVDLATTDPLPATLVGSPASRVIGKSITEPIVAIGNDVNGGAPAGRLGEFRVWSVPLPDDEIRINRLVNPSGNEPDLLAYYPLDDGMSPGADARDLTGNHRPAKLEAVTPVARTAMVGNPGAVVTNIDGTPTSRIHLGNLPLAGRSFTIECWLKRRREGRGEAVVLQPESTERQMALYFSGDLLYMNFGSERLRVSEPVGADRWVHIATVYDHRAKTLSMYLDGRRLARRGSLLPLEKNDLDIGATSYADPIVAQMAELRVWSKARSDDEIMAYHHRRCSGDEPGLMVHLPLDGRPPTTAVGGGTRAVKVEDHGTRTGRTADLPITPSSAVVSAEYSTVGWGEGGSATPRPMLRRFYGFVDGGGQAEIMPGKRVEELVMRWIGNAQFEPTLLGYMEGAPPAPSENLTVNYDYDGATSVELTRSEDVSYSWTRNKDIGGGLDANFFLGAAWGVSGGIVLESKISEGHVGVRGNVNAQWRTNESSTVQANSTAIFRDRLELRGAYETDPHFPHLGNRYVPKNVGYALVISGMADVFITQMRRTGRMVSYEVRPVEDMPLDINTITFMINPGYSLNGSLDGLVGSHAADEKFYRHVPEMRSEYGSRYPAGYYNLAEAYNLKAQIDRWDTERETYFTNFDAKETGLTDDLLSDVPDDDELDSFGQVEVEDGSDEEDEVEDGRSDAEIREAAVDAYQEKKDEGEDAANERKAEIDKHFVDQEKRMEANAAFSAWQRRMENLQIQAAKRNIVNTYVWDADGGLRSEEQNFANTIEHSIGGSFSLNASLGGDANVTIGGFKFELQAMGTFEMTQSMTKSASATAALDLGVRLDGLETKGITDQRDYPLQPGEKVDRYRFMSFYLEGDTDHFRDFFAEVVDPEWLMSNDEEARALRQVAAGRPNKAWRVMHRVTYVERPALLGFGQDLRTDDNIEAAAEEVFSYFDALEQTTDELREDIGELKANLGQITRKLDGLAQTAAGSKSAPPDDLVVPADRLAALLAGGDPAADGVGPDNVNGTAADLGGPPAASNGAPPGRQGDDTSNGAGVDLNAATEAELELLPGIGAATAARIVAYRSAAGGFGSVDELTEVAGIGPSKLTSLRPLLAVI